MALRKDFIWGTATSACQIEGASNIDGKGLSNWELYPLIDNVCYQNQNPNDGGHHYTHMEDDVRLLAELGVKAYRFSFAWTRILPEGLGKINPKGLEFYDRLLDELEKYGIEPYGTIFHWDYPYELVKKGGWLNDESPLWFLEYTKILVDRYKNRIKNWIPLNEPSNVLEVGGHSLKASLIHSTKEKLQMLHNILLAHGHAAQYIKANGGRVGTALCSLAFAPYDENCKEDIEAAKKALFDVEKDDIWRLSIWSDPMILGKYPDKYYELYCEFERPYITKKDMRIISTPLDFLGYNLYSGTPVKSDGKGGYVIMNHPIGNPKTNMDSDVYPKIMYWVAKFIYERYPMPFYFMENGCAITDIVSEDKKVHDGPRIEFIKQHIKQVKRACADGIDIRAYFIWSFLDNFEWFNGYSKRFGIVYIDYQTKERIKKDSFEFYKEIIKQNGNNL
ncbi:MAG: glycoside hydrolase family 1 protein [Bacilli bacterium]